MIEPRTRADGSTAYMVRVKVRGKRLPAETFTLKREARERERELLGQHDPGRWSRETCDAFAERWPDDYPVVKTGPTKGRRKTEGTIRTNRESLRPFIAEFQGLRLTDLDRPTARAFAVRHPRAAIVARNAIQDAMDDGLVETNPFARLQIERGDGRRYHAPLTQEEVAELESMARLLYPEYGPIFAAMIRLTAYTGPRLQEGCELEQRDVQGDELEIRKAKFDKPRRVILLSNVTEILGTLPRPIRADAPLFTNRRGQRLTKTAHFHIWDSVRKAVWAQLPEERRAELVDLDWHSLRHFCGFHFYVELGFSDELTAYQLGHSDAKLVRDLYGHGKVDALERIRQGLRTEVRALPGHSNGQAAGQEATA